MLGMGKAPQITPLKGNLMLKELVLANRSKRSFAKGEPISRETLAELCELARNCPAAMNKQPLKYRLVTDQAEIDKMLTLTRWASSLSQKLPPVGHEPSAFIVICHDTSIAQTAPIFMIDVGIVAQTMMLGAAERGLGGCMIGSGSSDSISSALDIPSHLIPKLVLGLGVPDEKVVLTEAQNGEVTYYRDENNIHYVPKRPLDEIIF